MADDYLSIVITDESGAMHSPAELLETGWSQTRCALSFVPMTLIQYYLDKLVNPDPDPRKLPDGSYALAKLPVAR